MSEKERAENTESASGKDAQEYVAERIAEHANPAIARVLTGDKSATRVNSEQAHRIAAQIARDHDRRNGR